MSLPHRRRLFAWMGGLYTPAGRRWWKPMRKGLWEII